MMVKVDGEGKKMSLFFLFLVCHLLAKRPYLVFYQNKTVNKGRCTVPGAQCILKMTKTDMMSSVKHQNV